MTELYKTYRPKTLDRIVGNEETVTSLENMIKHGTLPHSILLNGPSGCGKTTIGRIIKAALGCSDMDFKEINSSSFRGIDTVRDIQRIMGLAPAAGPVRIWLLDEVHKMSNDAQNAALKMLEDTPAHVYFILCTTDPQKLIKAILNRCSQMPVRALTDKELASLCDRVAKRENIELSEKTKRSICDASQGSARLMLVLLEKIAQLPENKREAAIDAKLAEENEAIELCRALIKRTPWKGVAKILKDLKGEPEQIRWAVLGYARAVLLNTGEWQAYNVIMAFQNNFYDSKDAGLAMASYEAVSVKE